VLSYAVLTLALRQGVRLKTRPAPESKNVSENGI
jgi:hypothetical protein